MADSLTVFVIADEQGRPYGHAYVAREHAERNAKADAASTDRPRALLTFQLVESARVEPPPAVLKRETPQRILAEMNKWTGARVREFLADLEPMGVMLTYNPVTPILCPCGYHYATASGLCVACEADRDIDRQREEDEAEKAKLARDTERRLNQAKKARERMRRRFLANPRDADAKDLLSAVDEFIALMGEHLAENDDEWEGDEADEAAYG